MYTNLPIWLSLLFIVGSLVALAWSSDAFVVGAAALARKMGISAFIVGMVIIGFGTCAPEFCVSIFSGASGHTNLSLGNAFGSCLFNILGVLGIAALVRPIVVKPLITFLAAPLMALVTILAYSEFYDGVLSRWESLSLLLVFAIVMPAYCWCERKVEGPSDEEQSLGSNISNLMIAFNLVVGFVVMVGASHLLVWGSVNVARAMGVNELVIGLTIVAIGTSVPELATAIASARRNESELVMGNIVGSNLFNTLCVVGTAGAISPAENFSRYVESRDLPLLILVTLSIVIFGINWRKRKESGRINRMEGFLWVLIFIIYMIVMVMQEVHHG